MIYIASSWKNTHKEGVADCLDQWAIPHYDFWENDGFAWSKVDPNYQDQDDLTLYQYKNMLRHKEAELGYARDVHAMEKANACILILPCGRSAHLEAGWFIGAGKHVAIYFKENPVIPELMYKLAEFLTDDIDALMYWASRRGT